MAGLGQLKGAFSAKNIVMIIVFAIVGIYLFGEFTTKCTQTNIDNKEYGCTTIGDLAFVSPTSLELEGIALKAVQFIIIGIAVFMGYGVVMKMSNFKMSKKDILTLALIGVAVYFLWTYVIEEIWTATSLSDISFIVGKKIGLL